ncbi:MAG: hypothetical protein PVF70_13620 [Anaerolineales bacterium]|jgi:hypothetical protein
MGTRPSKSIAELLNAAQLAINNSVADAEIMELVAAYGYDSPRFQDGRMRYLAAVEAVDAKEAAAGAQHDATEKEQKARSEAKDAYQALAKVARAIFKGDQPALTAMELRGPMPQATAPFLARAYLLFDNALKMPELMEALAPYGYDAARLQAERDRIVAYDQSNQDQEAAKGAAQDATRAQVDALALLRDWYAQYRKIARVALRGRRQLLEKLGIPARTSRTKAQAEALRRRRSKTPAMEQP